MHARAIASALPVRSSLVRVMPVLLALAALAPAAFAARTVVALDGSGEFTSIQAAIDSMYARRTPTSPPDTVVVMAGFYDETIAAYDSESDPILFITCPAGPEHTRVRRVSFPPYGHYYWAHPADIEGLGVVDRAVTGEYFGSYRFRNCRFEGGFEMPVDNWNSGLDYGAPILTDCEFLDTAVLVLPAYGTMSPLSGLIFRGARTLLATGFTGSGALKDCVFEGPMDTLVVARPRTDNEVILEDCLFQNAEVGVVKHPSSGFYGYDAIRLLRCRFVNLTNTAIGGREIFGMNWRHAGIEVRDSRFESCGTVMDWDRAGFVEMLRDTVDGHTRGGIAAVSHLIELDSLVFDSGGAAIRAVVVPIRLPPWQADEAPGRLSIRGNSLAGCTTTAISVTDTVLAPRTFQLDITHNTILNASGPGIVVRAPRAVIRGNTVVGCDGPGIAITPLEPLEGFVVDSNTVVGNHGDGIGFTEPWYSGPRVFQHNLVARNDGAGLRVGTPFSGSVAFNGAWQNALGDYAQVDTPLDSNLVTDPRFCDLAAGDVRLQFGSPCGAGGPYGQIGALPEACPSTAGIGPPRTGAAFAIHPNPARGEVAFSLGDGPPGVLEILDVQGRQVWIERFAAGSRVLRWRGTSDAASVSPGLYWARLVRGVAQDVRRLLWLR